MSTHTANPKILAIVGPTASGKTTLGIALAKKLNGEIVSADSRQIYRGMDIGTAKPTAIEQCEIPHHLINICDPTRNYTVTDYETDAVAAIHEILSRGKLPIIVGGTGLYIKSVVENLDIPKVKANPALRAQIEESIRIKGLESVFKELLERDPDAEGIVDPKNPRRVVRALEVAITTGEPFTTQRQKRPPLFETLTIGLNPPLEILRERIITRIDQMMRDNFENEVRTLVKKYGAGAPALNAIGYRELVEYLVGNSSLENAIALIKTNTVRYAKRQLTWFRKDKTVQWMNGDSAEAIPLVKDFLHKKSRGLR
jgi:tRNA dimethylallyltransferase